MEIGGNQAGAFPKLPVQPRNLQFSRKAQLTALDFSKTIRKCCKIGPEMVQIANQKVAFIFSVGCIKAHSTPLLRTLKYKLQEIQAT